MNLSDEHLDQLLRASGERWRNSQPRLDSVGVATLVRQRGHPRSANYLFGPAGALGLLVVATVALIALLVGGPLGSPAQTIPTIPPNASPTTGGWPNTFYLENRGGPAFTVAINNAEVTTVACGSYLTLTPGVDNVPQLPWDLAVTRIVDGNTLVAQPVAELPRWLVQIGDEPLFLSDMVVMGPMGPTCPPASSPPFNSPLCTQSEASHLAVIEAVNLDRLNFGGVYIDDNGMLVIQYVGANAGRAAVEQKITCAEAVRWEMVERSRADLDRILTGIGNRLQSGEAELSGVFAVELDTINNQIVVWVGPGGSLTDASHFLAAAYGEAVRVEFSSDIPVVH